MSIFSDKITDSKIELLQMQYEMKNISEKINKVVKLSDEEKRDAEYFKAKICLSEYEIGLRSFPWTEWEPIFVVLPKGVSPYDFGYSASSGILPPAQWRVFIQGTSSCWSFEEEIERDILEKLLEETSFNL